MKNTQQKTLNQISRLIEMGLSFKDSPFIKEKIDLLLQEDINLNQTMKVGTPTLLFASISNASWDLFNYFVLKGADVHYRTDYKTHKNINCIEFAEILLQDLKTKELPNVNDELKDVDRLDESFDKGQSESEITMQEFYAFKSQGDILKQVIFIEEFLRKFP